MKLLWTPFNLKPREVDPNAPRYADIYVRGVAAGIDLLILFVMLNPFFRILAHTLYQHIDRDKMDAVHSAATNAQAIHLLWESHVLPLWIINASLQLTLIAVLMIGCQWLWLTTPGKWLMGLKVVRAKTLETPPRWRLALRFFAYAPSMLPLMMGMVWASFNKQRRGWHDYIAGTAVIHTRPRDWEWTQTKQAVKYLRQRITNKH